MKQVHVEGVDILTSVTDTRIPLKSEYEFAIGSRIDEFITKNELTQKLFAELTGLNYPMINQYTKNNRTPGSEVLFKFWIQGMSIDWLLSGQNTMYSDNENGFILKTLNKDLIYRFITSYANSQYYNHSEVFSDYYSLDEGFEYLSEIILARVEEKEVLNEISSDIVDFFSDIYNDSKSKLIGMSFPEILYKQIKRYILRLPVSIKYEIIGQMKDEIIYRDNKQANKESSDLKHNEISEEMPAIEKKGKIEDMSPNERPANLDDSRTIVEGLDLKQYIDFAIEKKISEIKNNK